MGVVAQEYRLAKLDELTPHPENPRRGDVDLLSQSLDRNGFYGAVVVQTSTGHILAGNHRLAAARAAGLDEIPAIFVDVEDEVAKRILLADNRTSDAAGYDDEQLLELLASLTASAGDLDALIGTGYTSRDLDKLVNDLEKEADKTRELGESLGKDEELVSEQPHFQFPRKGPRGWSVFRVQLRPEELERLNAVMDAYLEEHGSQFGFLSWLLEGVEGRSPA